MKHKTEPQNNPKTSTEKAKPKLHKPKPSDAKNSENAKQWIANKIGTQPAKLRKRY